MFTYCRDIGEWWVKHPVRAYRWMLGWWWVLKEICFAHFQVDHFISFILHTKLTSRHKLCKCVTLWRNVMPQTHRIWCGTTGEAFQKQVFCGRKELLVVQTSFLFLSFTCTRTYINHRRKEKKIKKHDTCTDDTEMLCHRLYLFLHEPKSVVKFL